MTLSTSRLFFEISDQDLSYSAFILATSELGQTGLVLFLKVDSSTTTGTSQVLATLLISTFENKTKPVCPSSEVASVNALLS